MDKSTDQKYGKQLTKEQAIAIFQGEEWKNWSAEKIVRLQLFQDRLCVPFGIFHEAIEKVLDRPVWTHEVALNRDGVIEEFLGGKKPPTMDEIIELIPKEKRIVVSI